MTVSSNVPTLFTPLKVGNVTLQHRIAVPPTTRFRAPNHIPSKDFVEHYEQRAARAGTLIIGEATVIAAKAGGYDGVPAIWSQEQIEGWKKVISSVHSKDSFIFLQLWALGRVAVPSVLEKDGIASGVVSASDIGTKESGVTPRPLTREEIKEYIQLYVQAAKNAIEAGADGIEIHSANGYLPDQFLHENINQRTDEYGGSIENRARFVLEIIDALIEAIGADKVAVRFAPWGKFNEVDPGVSPIPQWSYVISELEKRAQQGNRLAFIDLVEPRVSGNDDFESDGSNEFARNIWQGILLRSGGLTNRAEEAAEEDPKSIIGIGRYFVSNPDIVNKIEKKAQLTTYDRATFYATDPYDTTGYNEYGWSK